MIYYWIVFIFLALTVMLLPDNQFSLKRGVRAEFIIFGIFCSLLLIIFAGFRKESNDYQSYLEIFNIVPDLSTLSKSWIKKSELNVEYGYILLNSIIKLFSNNIVVFMTIVAFISVGTNFYVIKIISPFIFVSILLYFVHPFLLKETIQIRQGIASALVLLALYFYSEKKVFKSLCIIIIGASFQSVAYCCLFFLPFAKIQFKPRMTIMILIFIVIASFIFSGKELLDLIVNYFQLPDSIMYYFGWEIYDYKLGLFSPVLLKQVFFLSLMIINKDELLQSFKHFNVLYNFYFFAILWYIYFNEFAIIAARVSNILNVGEFILIPMLISISKPSNRFLFIIIIVFLSSVILFLNTQNPMVFPYKNIFLK